MNAEILLENFEVLAEAPGGINRLRELILQLATNGKLLNSSARKTNPATGLPETWMLEPFNEVAQFAMGKTPPTKNPDFWGGVNSTMWVSIGDMQDGQTITESKKTVSLKAGSEVFRREPWPEGTLLMSFKLTIGKMARLGHPAFFNEAIFAFDAGNEITNEYLFRVLPLISRSANSKGAIKGNTLNSESISQMRVPVPPLNEQKRIVAKVDELMALCDQLELQKQSRDNLRVATRKSAIDAISTANTPEAFETAWKRIENNWEVIADTPESVGSLRSLILDLAVRGRLQNEVVQEFDPVSGLPIRWELQRLDQVCIYIQRGKGPQYADLSKCAVVSQKCVQWNGFDISKARFVDELSLNSYGEERILRNGDILWNSTGTGTVGRTAIYFDSNLFEKVVADSHVTVLRAPDMNPQFLWSWTASPAVQSLITDLTSGTTNQQELNLSSIKSLLVPVPPLPEQNIIVTKVEELMAICDQLESGLDVRRDVAEKFARSVVSFSGTTEFKI